MPCLSRLFRSKSSLTSRSNVRDLRVNVEPEINGDRLTRAQVARLRRHVNAAQDALTKLDTLVSALEKNADALSDSPASTERAHPFSSSNALSVAIHVDDMKRSTRALNTILHKHVPEQHPTETPPISAPDASSTQGHDLYPAPLRLPLRSPPIPACQYPDAPSPFHDEEMSFLDWQLRRRRQQHHSLNSAMPPYPPTAPTAANRPTSLPPPARGEALTSPYTAYSSHFNTGDKTRKLRSIQGPVPLLDMERPLGMDELMTFLREGNSIRQL